MLRGVLRTGRRGILDVWLAVTFGDTISQNLGSMTYPRPARSRRNPARSIAPLTAKGTTLSVADHLISAGDHGMPVGEGCCCGCRPRDAGTNPGGRVGEEPSDPLDDWPRGHSSTTRGMVPNNLMVHMWRCSKSSKPLPAAAGVRGDWR
jgi:hypothetical protein